MSRPKRLIKRADLIHQWNDAKHSCVLCGRVAVKSCDIAHKVTCVFANNCITGIRIDGVSGGVVFRAFNGGWRWVSPASDNVYVIEKWPGCYVLIDSNRTAIHQETKLYDLRLWVGLHQGVL